MKTVSVAVPEDIWELLETGISRRALSRQAGLSESEARFFTGLYANRDLEVEHNALVGKRTIQRYQDTQRIERKIYRVNNRYHNALTEYGKAILKTLNETFDVPSIEHEDDPVGVSGVFQLTDLHLNELINILGNQYDFNVAAKRLKKMVIHAIKYFNLWGVKEVYVTMLGDMINSDRRLDELLNQAVNRSKATVLAVMLLKQVLMELNEHFSLKVAYVSGNESRVGKELGHSEILLSDNYDTMIFEFLKQLFLKSKSVEFFECEAGEQLVNIQGQEILLIHGHQIGENKTGHKIQEIVGKYAQKGFKIFYTLFGHLHEARVADRYARGSSLCGDNAYSSSGLQLSGRASQLIHLVTPDSIHSIKIDLQNTGKIKGYYIQPSLEAYNAKSADKVRTMKRKVI